MNSFKISSANVPSDFYLEVAKGSFPGYVDYSAFGVNFDIDTTSTPEDIWLNGGVFVPPTTYRIHNISSSSVNDTVAGTGARTLLIQGVISTGLSSEIINMNGISTVATVNSYSDIYAMEVLTAGSGTMNAGNISAVAQTDGTTTAFIAINGLNSAKKAIRLIPPGYIGYLYNFQGGMQQATATSFADVSLQTKTSTGVWISRRFHGLSNTGSSVEDDVFKSPLVLSTGTWVKIQCTNVTNNNTIVQGEFNLLLIKN